MCSSFCLCGCIILTCDPQDLYCAVALVLNGKTKPHREFAWQVESNREVCSCTSQGRNFTRKKTCRASERQGGIQSCGNLDRQVGESAGEVMGNGKGRDRHRNMDGYLARQGFRQTDGKTQTNMSGREPCEIEKTFKA